MRHGGEAAGFGRRWQVSAKRAGGSEDAPAGRGRLFPGLAPIALLDSGGGDDRAHTLAALASITAAMHGGVDAVSTGPTPAAYTYFGQFVFHDMVFSLVFGGVGDDRPPPANAVSPALDLTGLYGRGPIVDSHLYDGASPADPTPCRFPLGLPAALGSPDQPPRPVDPAAVPGRDVPRLDAGSPFLAVQGARTPRRPLIADPRNDDNLVLSQLLCALMTAHNRLVDLMLADFALPPAEAFRRGRDFLVGAYRGVVVGDYLRRILAPAIWDHFFAGPGLRGAGAMALSPDVGLPMEFTFGAARFAHAMVREHYAVNGGFPQPQPLERLLAFSSQRPGGTVPVPEDWMVEWSRLLDLGPPAALQNARRIGPFIARRLVEHPLSSDDDGTPRSIVLMDLWRCYDLGLPSGQAVAAAVAAAAGLDPAATVLRGERVLPTADHHRRLPFFAGRLAQALGAWPQVTAETPLSYYVLQEAAVLGDDGERLGPAGSFIVAAAVAAALADGHGPAPRPPAGGPATLAGLVAMADPARVPDDTLRRYLDPDASS